MEKHYRKYARKFYRMLRHPRQRRRSAFHLWMSNKVFDRQLWIPERHAFMNGLAAGMFISMLPLFVPQMLVALLVCIWRRWNAPIAMLCCWISNVATLVPLIYIQVILGMKFLAAFTPDELPQDKAFETLENVWTVWRHDGSQAAYEAFYPVSLQVLESLALPWGIGVMITAIVLAAGSYTLGHILWSIFVHRVPVPHKLPHRSID